MTDDSDVAQMEGMLKASGRRGVARTAARLGWVMVAVPWMIKTDPRTALLAHKAGIW